MGEELAEVGVGGIVLVFVGDSLLEEAARSGGESLGKFVFLCQGET